VDPVVETLRAAVDSNSAQVLKLRAAVVSLQKQAAAIAKGANVPVVQAGTTSTWHSSSSSARKTYTSSSSSTSSGSSTKTTVSRPAPAPAPNPPVAASGGS
jgi:1-acyl-sn-glycerol-3-phosphate acyltransferase